MNTWLAALVGSFVGSASGVVYCIRQAIKQMHKMIEEDNDMKKIDIHVTMVPPDD